MPQHFIQFFDDPISPRRKQLGRAFADSLADALARAEMQLENFKTVHSKAGYRIEDQAGRTVAIGPKNP